MEQAEFEAKLREVIVREIEEATDLLSAERLSGGASQETYRLRVDTSDGERLLCLRRAAGGLQHEEAQHPDRCVGVGDLLLHHLVVGDDLAVRFPAQRPLAHHVEGELALGDGAHRVVDASAAEEGENREG